ncbi:MAG: amidohydrolase [Acidobacteriota bacterium]
MSLWLNRLSLFCLVLLGLAEAEPIPGADLILSNGRIWTGGVNPSITEALAIKGDRILAAGSTVEIDTYQSEETERIDLQGRFVMPGFIDNHTHFLEGGFQLLGLDLRISSDEQDFARRIGERAEWIPRGEWITGGDWDHESWPSQQVPHKRLIDPVTAHTPVFVTRLDGHMGLANRLALKLAGIDQNTPDPPGGMIIRHEDGEPTGLLKDAAMDLVTRVIPAPSEAERRQALQAALDEAARLGVTTVNAMASSGEIRLYQNLLREGALSLRVYALTPLPDYEDLQKIGIQRGLGNDYLKIGASKGFMDGSLGSSTAWFYEPYLDAPETRGIPSAMWLPEGNMKRLVKEADSAGLHVAVHAIGARANDEILKIFEEVSRENGDKDRRFRIEHAQHLTTQTIGRFDDLGVIASMQPYHTIDDGRWAEKRIGPERIRTSYAFRSLLKAGAILTFGSDWPVAPLNPLLGVYAAVTRRTLDGKNPQGWVPEEKISTEEALVCYTVNNAFAIFQEDQLGTLEAGQLADLIVLSANPLEVDPVEIADIQVIRTIVGGKTVYSRR